MTVIDPSHRTATRPSIAQGPGAQPAATPSAPPTQKEIATVVEVRSSITNPEVAPSIVTEITQQLPHTSIGALHTINHVDAERISQLLSED